MPTSHVPGGQSRPRGFTLVELLVVISILALLISVLLPSLSSARASARTAACQSNLRQIVTGWTMYADQYNGVMVAGRMGNEPNQTNVYAVGNGDQYRPRWFVQIGAASGFYAFDTIRANPGNPAESLGPSPDPALANNRKVTNPVFLCPERPDWTNNRNYTYGYNFQFLGNGRSRNDTAAAGKINWPVRLTLLKSPQATVVAADSLGTAATFATGARTPYNPDAVGVDLTQMGNHGWALDPPRLTPTSDFCDNNHRGEARSGPDPRHANEANIAYADTHVETQLPSDVGYSVAEDGSYPLAVPATARQPHNRFFSTTGQDDDPPPWM